MGIQWRERGWRRDVEGTRVAQGLRERLCDTHSSALREFILPDGLSA